MLHIVRGKVRVFFRNPPATSPATAKLGRMPALDGIRGVAVLCVLLDHASDAGMQIFPGADLNRLGKYGVFLFFVLSAFLLTHQFYRRSREELIKPAAWGEYARRRFLRIFPLYTVVLLAMIAMGKLSFTDLWTHLLLQDGKRVFWTIAVEVKFYMLLPLLVLALFWAGRHKWWLGVIGSLAAAAIAAGFLLLEQGWSLHPNVLLLPNLPAFLLGSATAIAYGRMQNSEAAGRWATLLEAAAIAAFLAILLRLPLIYNFVFQDDVGKLGEDEIYCGALWSVVVFGTLQGRGWLAAALSWAPLRYLGLISFSAYLWHWKFLSDFDDLPLPPILRLVIFLAVVIAISSVSYFLLERPLLRLRRHDREVPPRL